RRLPKGTAADAWLLLRGNLDRLSDFAAWFRVIHGEIDPPELNQDERIVVREAAAGAPQIDCSAGPWKTMPAAVKAAPGAKGRELFHPLRVALTGRDSGPEMAG